MPHDLFDDVVVHRSSPSRRSPVVVFSVVAHATALVALLIVPLMATDTLPTPKSVVDSFVDRNILPVIFAPIARRPPQSGQPQDRTPPVAATTPGTPAPVEAPTGITPEDPSALPTTSGSGSRDGREPGFVEGLVSDAIGGGQPLPPAPPTGPIRLSAGVRAPRKLVDVAPIYPALARATRVQGVVVIEATIDTRGNVEAARVIKSVGLLDQAALDAVRQWKFSPTLLNGVPVPIIMTVTVNFMLQ